MGDCSKESELYVRDLLLIQWLLNEFRILVKNNDIEQVYKEWKKWIDKEEAKHGERSEI